jgi:hypothetical protein
MPSPANFKATGSVAGFLLRPEIARSNVVEVNHEVVHQQRSYFVFGFGRFRIIGGRAGRSASTASDHGRSR